MDALRISCYATPSASEFDEIIRKAQLHISCGEPVNRLPHSMQISMLAGFAIAEVLADIAEVIEIYPQANARLLNVAGKHKTKQDQSRVQLKAISEYTGWPSTDDDWESVADICKAPTHDKVDAYSAAWIASLPEQKRQALGSVEDNDAIWVPRLASLNRIQNVDWDIPETPLLVSYGVAAKTTRKEAKDEKSKQRRLCPACKAFEFKMWPFGWDAHAAYKCKGIAGNDPEERKRLFKEKYMG